MPELPEVETIRRDLESRVVGLTIEDVRLGDTLVIREPAPDAFAEGLRGCRIEEVSRRGKFLVLRLGRVLRTTSRVTPEVLSVVGAGLAPARRDLVILPRMTGQLVYGADHPSAHIRMRLSDGNWLTYADQRKFGEIRLVEDWRAVRGVSRMGPEPLNGGLTPDTWWRRLHARRVRIKPLLLQQDFIAGIGNIYAQEALWEASIRPTRRSDRLTRAEAIRLLTAIRRVLQEGIRRRGVSARNYVDGLGRRGRMQGVLRVYRKGGRPCPRCGTSLTARAIGQRGTVWCRSCQT